MGAGDTLVGAGSAHGPLTWPRSRPLGTKNRSERAHSEALEDLVKLESLGVHCQQLAASPLRQSIRYPAAGGGIVHRSGFSFLSGLSLYVVEFRHQHATATKVDIAYNAWQTDATENALKQTQARR